MAISSISSNQPVAQPTPRQEAKPVIDKPVEQAPPPPPPPVVNTSGQMTGTLLSTAA